MNEYMASDVASKLAHHNKANMCDESTGGILGSPVPSGKRNIEKILAEIHSKISSIYDKTEMLSCGNRLQEDEPCMGNNFVERELHNINRRLDDLNSSII